jgi:hypothetical protein
MLIALELADKLVEILAEGAYAVRGFGRSS